MTAATVTIPAPTGGDDTAMLVDAISDARTGSTINFPDEATYIVDGSFAVWGKVGLTINGNGCIFTTSVPGALNRSHIRLERCTDVTLHEMEVAGANPHAGTGDAAYDPQYEAQHAFEIIGSIRCTLTDVAAHDVYGDFVYVGSSGVPSSDITVLRPTFHRNGRQALAVVAATGVDISGAVISDVRRSLLDVEPNAVGDSISQITFRDSAVANFRLSFLASKGAAAPVSHITIANIAVTGSSLSSEVNPPSGRRGPITITDCTSDTPHGTGSGLGGTIRLTRCDGVTVTGCTQPMDEGRSMALVNLTDCTSVDVSGNTVPNGIESRVLT